MGGENRSRNLCLEGRGSYLPRIRIRSAATKESEGINCARKRHVRLSCACMRVLVRGTITLMTIINAISSTGNNDMVVARRTLFYCRRLRTSLLFACPIYDLMCLPVCLKKTIFK